MLKLLSIILIVVVLSLLSLPMAHALSLDSQLVFESGDFTCGYIDGKKEPGTYNHTAESFKTYRSKVKMHKASLAKARKAHAAQAKIQKILGLLAAAKEFLLAGVTACEAADFAPPPTPTAAPGSTPTPKPTATPTPSSGGSSTAGRQLYDSLCNACHPSYSSKGGTSYATLKDRLPDSPMFITLSDSQLQDLAAFLATQ